MRFQKNSVHVTLKMIYANQWLAPRLRQLFAVGDAHKQRAYQPRTARNRNRVQILERDSGLFERFAHHWNDLAQVLARGQLRYHAAIFTVKRNLRCDDAGKNRIAAGNHGSGGLVTGRFNAQNDFALRGQEYASNLVASEFVMNMVA